MSLIKQTRREFLNRSGSMISGSWIAMNSSAIIATVNFACQAKKEGAPFEVLTEIEAKEIEAMAAQIFPSDDTPGATEAGIIYFIDRALATIREADKEIIQKGLVEFKAKILEKYPGNNFSNLNPKQQIAMLKEIEQTDFFETVRNLTISGMFAMPSYGGNKDNIGWEHLGFDHSATWKPPFGYYDEQYMNDGGKNEK